MAELADAIVATARATLEATIHFIDSHPTWRARVVYGDTDSVFVHVPGRTRAQSFALGAEIAKVITARNPSPIKLKFEKVPHPPSSSHLPQLFSIFHRFHNQTYRCPSLFRSTIPSVLVDLG